MKQKLCLFTIHQTATSLQRAYNLNLRTRWYPTLDESNRMKTAYFTIHPGKSPPPQKGCQLKSSFFFWKHRFHILQFPDSTGLFTKPTGRHYTKYRFSPDIGWHPLVFIYWIGVYLLKSSKMIGTFPAVLNFIRLFLKLNRCICNSLPVLPDHRAGFLFDSPNVRNRGGIWYIHQLREWNLREQRRP